MMRYAQIDDNGVCISDSTLSGVIDAPNMIPLADSDPSRVAMRWTSSGWEVVPEPQGTKPRRVSKLAFRSRFTAGEKVALYEAAERHVLIRIWLDDLAAAHAEADGTAVDLEDPRIVEGVYGLVAAGLITEQRAAEVLA